MRPFALEPATLRDLGELRQLEKECFDQDAWPLIDLVGVLSLPGIIRIKAVVDETMVGFAAAESHVADGCCNHHCGVLLLSAQACPLWGVRRIPMPRGPSCAIQPPRRCCFTGMVIPSYFGSTTILREDAACWKSFISKVMICGREEKRLAADGFMLYLARFVF